MHLDAIKALIANNLDQVEQLLEQQLDSPIDLIKQIGSHLIQAGGKRIRPILVILISKAYGNTSNTDVSLGAAIELIHAATLLHDDVVDNSQLRRGIKTANALWDNAASVLVGDFLYSRAFQLIVSVKETELLPMLAEATNIIAAGEVMQLQNRHNPSISEKNYLNVLRYKTGALFAAATQAGAILAYRPDQEVEVMKAFGQSIGVAFQLVDDALDYSSDTHTLGKTLGDDLADGKITMPLLHALQHGSSVDRQCIREAITQGNANALGAIQSIIQNTGSIAYTLNLAKEEVEQAKHCLRVLEDSPYKEALFALTDLIIERDY